MNTATRLWVLCAVCMVSFGAICLECVSDDEINKRGARATGQTDYSMTEPELAFRPSPAWTTFWTGTDKKAIRAQQLEIGKWLVEDHLGNNGKGVIVLSLEVMSVGNFRENQFPNLQMVDDVRSAHVLISERTTKLIRVQSTDGTFQAFDELYSYDGLHRLKNMGRGTLSFGDSSLATTDFAQCWTLDSTSNWSGFKEATSGGSWTTVQSRTANTVNEISDITNTVGSSWVMPAYDAAGNMNGSSANNQADAFGCSPSPQDRRTVGGHHVVMSLLFASPLLLTFDIFSKDGRLACASVI